MKLHVSNGNSKLGEVMNTSFPPVITCRKGAPCATEGCYALKFYKLYPSCKTAWDENLRLYKENPSIYWAQLCDAVQTRKYFRYFVSGDIPDAEYFAGMISLAASIPDTQFLCFTKQFEIVNSVYGKYCQYFTFPRNLHILFSTWNGFKPDNPYNFPETAVYEKGEEIPEEWLLCGGNCTNCACRGVGCWQAKPGDTIAFQKH